jgi:hypothetical protein
MLREWFCQIDGLGRGGYRPLGYFCGWIDLNWLVTDFDFFWW